MTTPYAPTRWQVPTNGTGDDQDVFPFLAGQSFLQKKTPVWSTKVDTSVSGVERRRALWSYPVWKFKLSYEVLRSNPSYSELQRLYTFFNMKAGQFQSWFYFDPYDNTVSNQLIGYGDGSTTTFQLARSSTIGTITYTEPVRGVYGTPTVSVNGISTAYTIGTGGTVTFATAPAVGAYITWSGQFFFLCRFLSDELDAQQLLWGIYTAQGIEFQSVKS